MQCRNRRTGIFFLIWGEYLKRGRGKREGKGGKREEKKRKREREKGREKEGEIKQCGIQTIIIIIKN
jgi:hypothetical protein